MEAESVVTLDLRELPPRERHERIFDVYHHLPINGTIKLINDHDPKPLYYQFQAEHPGEVSWEPQEQGPETWVINIVKLQDSCC